MRKVIVVGLLGLAVILGTGSAPAQSKKTQELIKDLKDKNPKVRIGAAEDLGRLASVKLADAKSALPALRAAQKDADPGVRKAVLEALGQIEEPKSYTPLLIDTLKKEKDPGVLVTATSALVQLTPPPKSALPALTEAHKAALAAQKDTTDPQRLRATLLNAIAKLDPDPKKLVPVYIDVLKRERNVPIKLQTVTALGQIGPPAKGAIPALLEVQRTAKLLKDKDMGLAKEAESALQKIQAKSK